MKIFTPLDKEFDYSACENLYKKIACFMGNRCEFADLVNKTHFYSFYDGKNFLGCAYVVSEEGKLFLNGFSVRKNHRYNICAVKKLLTFYNCDIYSKTRNKAAGFLLKKCGFNLICTDSDGMKYYKEEK